MATISIKVDKTLPKCGFDLYCNYIYAGHCHYRGDCDYKLQGATGGNQEPLPHASDRRGTDK